MATYLAERYWPGATEEAVVESVDRIQLIATALTNSGVEIACLRSIFIPADELVLFEFEAPSAEELRRLAALAGVVFSRITRSIVIPLEGPRNDDGHERLPGRYVAATRTTETPL